MSNSGKRDRPRLLFVYQKAMSFVKDDLKLLREHFDVETFEFGISGGARLQKARQTVGLFWKQRTWLRNQIKDADVVFGWFIDTHMGSPVRIAKQHEVPVAISVGGFDAMNIPEMNYGVYGTWRARIARYVARNSEVLLPVADSLVRTKNKFLPTSQDQGLRFHIPDLTTRIEVLPTGYKFDDWPIGGLERAASVLSVAIVDSDRTFRRKGLDLLVETARLLPDVPFTVVGLTYDVAVVERIYQPPGNVSFLPPQPRESLAKAYREASVYLQVSRAEGMPNVLCEAMLCGCIPVGSSAFGIPTAIGEAGFVVDRPDPGLIAETIRLALESKTELRIAARQQIVANFGRERRAERLLAILNDLVANGGNRRARH